MIGVEEQIDWEPPLQKVSSEEENEVVEVNSLKIIGKSKI